MTELFAPARRGQVRVLATTDVPVPFPDAAARLLQLAGSGLPGGAVTVTLGRAAPVSLHDLVVPVSLRLDGLDGLDVEVAGYLRLTRDGSHARLRLVATCCPEACGVTAACGGVSDVASVTVGRVALLLAVDGGWSGQKPGIWS